MSEPIAPAEIGPRGMIEKVADGVRRAIANAGITEVADVHTKTPLLTIHTIRGAKSRGRTVWTEHTHVSMNSPPASGSPSPSARSRCPRTPT